uniref:Uncharacterized protein n=2 Tax=Physcomitrium patens TaxID=3218 RepID=A0A2K1K4K8_PHYPA|nr:hypothetical protein PHYPA_013188 [Physcomitrium patens]
MVAIAFFDHMLVHFLAFLEVLIDQERECFEAFKALYTKALIDYYTTFRNYLEVDGFTKFIG